MHGHRSAWLYSVIARVLPGMFPSDAPGMGGAVPVYFEAAAVITALALLGQVLELRAREQTSGAIKALLGLAPKTARRICDDGSDEEVGGVETDAKNGFQRWLELLTPGGTVFIATQYSPQELGGRFSPAVRRQEHPSGCSRYLNRCTFPASTGGSRRPHDLQLECAMRSVLVRPSAWSNVFGKRTLKLNQYAGAGFIKAGVISQLEMCCRPIQIPKASCY